MLYLPLVQWWKYKKQKVNKQQRTDSHSVTERDVTLAKGNDKLHNQIKKDCAFKLLHYDLMVFCHDNDMLMVIEARYFSLAKTKSNFRIISSIPILNIFHLLQYAFN